MEQALLIIDPNNDFTDSLGRLYVPKAEPAVEAIAKYILEENPAAIYLSQDTHLSYHIGHCAYWTGETYPFGHVTREDVLSGRIVPRHAPQEQVLRYLEQLEARKAVHTLWPEHCMLGTWGWAFPLPLTTALKDWHQYNVGRRPLEVYQKGMFADAEMYSIFSYANANTLDPRGQQIMAQLATYDQLIVCGFAKDYCVAESVRDLRADERFRGKLCFYTEGMAAIDEHADSLRIYADCIEHFGATKI